MSDLEEQAVEAPEVPEAADYIKLINACKTVDQLAALPPVDWAHDPNWTANV